MDDTTNILKETLVKLTSRKATLDADIPRLEKSAKDAKKEAKMLDNAIKEINLAIAYKDTQEAIK